MGTQHFCTFGNLKDQEKQKLENEHKNPTKMSFTYIAYGHTLYGEEPSCAEEDYVYFEDITAILCYFCK